MNSFYIQAKKLKRKNTDLYLGTATLNEIYSWNLKNFSHQTMSELIYIHSDDLTVRNAGDNINNISVNNGYLMTVLPKADINDEFPVLISKKSPVSIILNALLEIDLFKSLIEFKTSKLSHNSTKIMTKGTLEKIIAHSFNKYSLEETALMLKNFIHYIEEVLNSYEYFKVYSVKSIQELKQRSLINSSFSWFIILMFFKDNYNNSVYTYQEIPKLDIEVAIDNWSGNFFDKSNPLWNEVFKTKRKFYPTNENLVRAYEVWKIYS